MDVIDVSHILIHVASIEEVLSLSLVCVKYRQDSIAPLTVHMLRDKFDIDYYCPTFPRLVEAYDRAHYGPRSHRHMHPTRLVRLAARHGCFRGIAHARMQGVTFTGGELEIAAHYGQMKVVEAFVHDIPDGYCHAAIGYSMAISCYPGNERLLMKIVNKHKDIDKGCLSKVVTNLIRDGQVETLLFLYTKGKAKANTIYNRDCQWRKYEVACAFIPFVDDQDVVSEVTPWVLDMNLFTRRVQAMKVEQGVRALDTWLINTERRGLIEQSAYLRQQGARLTTEAFQFAFGVEDDRLVKELIQQYDKNTVAGLLRDVAIIRLDHMTLLQRSDMSLADRQAEMLSFRGMATFVDAITQCCSPLPSSRARFYYAVIQGREQDVEDAVVEKEFTEYINPAIIDMARAGRRSMLCILLAKLEQGERATTIATLLHSDNEDDKFMDKDIRKLLEQEQGV